MKIAIQDANILIDLELSGLLDLWFQLEYETITTDLIIGQLRRGGHNEAISYVQAGKLQSFVCNRSFMQRTVELMHSIGSGPDIADCSVLLLAQEKDALLLTGDGKLRSTAVKSFVEVHGTLWIFDQLVSSKLLPPQTAAIKLSSLLEKERYLPSPACEARIKQWKINP